jgi:hypothetical protein
MAKKRKPKKKKPEYESYEFEIEDWEVDYDFGLNTSRRDLGGVYREYSTLILKGKTLSPVLEKATKANIYIMADPKMDDHWQPEPSILSAEATGFMVISRDGDTLLLHCSIPSRSIPYIVLAAQSGKIRYASIYGTKLKWRQGKILSLSLSTKREED